VRPVGLAVLVLVMLATQERPPQILQIYRDSVKEGGEAAYKAIEEDAARICADLRFPHPHLAIESLTGPKEVWWLNAFESEADRQQVTEDYTKNPALVAALEGIAKRKEEVTGTPVTVFATYRADLSRGVSWNPAGGALHRRDRNETRSPAARCRLRGTRRHAFPPETGRNAQRSRGAGEIGWGGCDGLRRAAVLGHASEGVERRRPGVLETEPDGGHQEVERPPESLRDSIWILADRFRDGAELEEHGSRLRSIAELPCQI